MKLIRILLIPFAWLYGSILKLRHLLYDKGWLTSQSFNKPVICVGNLALGGTGKTPFTVFLANMLQGQLRVAILSRGYKRTTKGFILINENASPQMAGDEPLLMKQQLRTVAVAVDENRARGLSYIFDRDLADLVILDDALQHRQVNAHLNILLTDYKNIYPKDHLLPAGNLRDVKSRAKDARIIVVTKCPPKVDFDTLLAAIKPRHDQHVFYTTTRYKNVWPLLGDQLFETDFLQDKGVVLFTGIAKPDYLVDFLRSKASAVETVKFPDHHYYQPADLKRVTEIFDNFDASSKLVITTEKDAVKLGDPKLAEHLLKMPVYVISIGIEFLKEEEKFKSLIAQYARTN